MSTPHSKPDHHQNNQFVAKHSPTPHVPLITTPTTGAQRKIAIAVDLSDEGAYAVRWSVENNLRPLRCRLGIPQSPIYSEKQ